MNDIELLAIGTERMRSCGGDVKIAWTVIVTDLMRKKIENHNPPFDQPTSTERKAMQMPELNSGRDNTRNQHQCK